MLEYPKSFSRPNAAPVCLYVKSYFHFIKTFQVRYEEHYNAESHQRIIKAADGVDNTYNYGQYGELTGISDQMGKLYELFYTDTGRLESVQYPDSSTQNFTYDPQGRMVSYKAQNGLTIAYEYTSQESVITIERPNEKFTYLSFDDVGRVTSASTPQLVQVFYNDQGLPKSFSNRNLGATGATLIYSYTEGGLLSGELLFYVILRWNTF